MAKVTAVEWFANRISHGGLVSKKQFNELVEQAKEMEKEQIIKFADEYELECTHPYKGRLKTAEQYYNETFSKEEQ